MQIVIDLDGVICEETKPYSKARVMPGASETMHRWKAEGHRIIIHTARRRGDRALTVKWLSENKIPWDKLILGKPKGDVYIDDKASKFFSWEGAEWHIS